MISILGLPAASRAAHGQPLAGLLFASFNAFWANARPLVEGPTFGFERRRGGHVRGDRRVRRLRGADLRPLHRPRGARPVVLGGSVLVALSFVVFWIGGSWSLVAIALGVLLIDIGINSAQIANQTRPTPWCRGAGADQHGAVHHVFAFAAIGAYAGSQGFLAFGWPGVCAAGLIFSGLAVWWRSATAECRGTGRGPQGKIPGSGRLCPAPAKDFRPL